MKANTVGSLQGTMGPHVGRLGGGSVSGRSRLHGLVQNRLYRFGG